MNKTNLNQTLADFALELLEERDAAQLVCIYLYPPFLPVRLLCFWIP